MRYRIIAWCCCLFALCSCEAYLDVEQPSVYTDQNYYKTPQDFDTAINGCYAQLQKIYNRSWLEAITSRCDEMRNSNTICRFMDSSLDSRWSTPYSAWWVLVYRCNQLLDRIDQVAFTDTDYKAHLKGEAYAMRGLAYLQFAWCWGGVPLIIQEMTRDEIRTIARASQEETYIQAVSDFEDAFSCLPEQWTGSNIGRVTRYAAAGMLGRTYMYMHHYEKAAEWLEKVVLKEGTLYELAANYKDCFDDVHNNSKERIWEVQYAGGTANKALGLSQGFSGWFIPSTATKAQDWNLLGISFKGNSGSARASFSIANNGAYEEGDKRKEATLTNGLILDKSVVQTDFWAVRKFLNATNPKPTAVDEYGNNLPILRYTDVKLMYAEALAQIDFQTHLTTEILRCINPIRKRAGLAEKTTADFTCKEDVIDYLQKERFVEFAFEGIRWADLIRWGIAEEKMTEHFMLKDEGFNETTEQPMYSMKPHNKLAPIPFSEILAYGDKNIMWQNEGY